MELDPLYKRSSYGKIKCIYTNDMLENGLIYLYLALQFNVINASTAYTKYKSQIQ